MFPKRALLTVLDRHRYSPPRCVVWVVFGIWTAGVWGTISGLSRQGCDTARGDRPSSTATQISAAGWSMRHWLPVGHSLAPRIAEQLIARGPLAGLSDEVVLVGESDGLAKRLRKAGWKVVLAQGGAEPRVEIFSPDRVLQWSGELRKSDFSSADAVMFDTVVLAKLARGEAVPPTMPVGCVTTLNL